MNITSSIRKCRFRQRLYNYFVSFDLDVEQMRRGAAYLVRRTRFCTILLYPYECKDNGADNHGFADSAKRRAYYDRITGNGFLYNMVRIIAGVLVRVGRGFTNRKR